MPTIPLPEKKKFSDYKRYAKRSKRDNLNHSAVYNTLTWRLLRLEKLRNQPLCEVCYSKGRIASAVDVHHLTPISEGKNKFEKQALGFDYDNLQSVCKECHKYAHK
jgi:5-methylcytosine-specific restriction protein A